MRKMLFLLMTLLTLSITFADTASNTNNNINISFVISSPNGQLQKTNDGQYRLTLHGVTPYITYYTFRPQHETGTAMLTNFINTWSVGGDNSFANNNPNVVVFAGIINGSDNESNHFTVSRMANPNFDIGSSTFTCTLYPLPNQKFLLDDTTLQHIVLVIN